MNGYLFRTLMPDDEPVLWRMLYEAAHLAEEGQTSPDAARHDCALARYAEGWGTAEDRGIAAYD